MKVPVFSVSYDGPSIDPNPPEINGYKELNKFQKESYLYLIDAKNGVMNASTGIGKTQAAENLAYCNLAYGDFKHVIITAPQTIIMDQYGNNNFIASNGDEVKWNIPKSNFYGTHGKPISNLTKNLEKDPVSYSYAIHIVSHAGFIKWCKNGNKELLHNCLVIIDEVHHGMNDNINGEEISNDLGKIKKWIIEQEDVGLMAMSATLFRSDGLKIIPNEYRDLVTFYHYDYTRYLQGLKYLKKFDYNIIYYDDANPLKSIQDIYKNSGHEKEIIYLPYVNSRYCWDKKEKEVIDIFNTIGTNVRKEDIFIRVNIDGVEKKYVDLVDESQRKRKKEYLKGDCKDLDGIVALGMGKEGFDWKYAQRLIVLGSRTSIVEIHQIYGRLTRDCPGKEKVCLYHVLPKPITGKVEESTNEYLLTFYLARQYGEMMVPLFLIVPDPGKGKYVKGLGIPKVKLLPEVLNGDLTACASFKIKCETKLGDYVEINPNSNINKKKNEFREIVQSVLIADYGVSQEDLDKLSEQISIDVTWRKIADQCWAEWTSSMFRVMFPGLPLDWSVISKMSPDEDIKWYKSKINNNVSWSEFSKNINSFNYYYDNIDTCKEIIKGRFTSMVEFREWRNSPEGDKRIPPYPDIYYSKENVERRERMKNGCSMD